MKIFLVPETSSTISGLIDKFDARPNVLVSFVRAGSDFRNFLHTYRPRLGELILDSGAFSDMQGTSKVDLNSYEAYLKGCGNLFDYCVNLDVEPENIDVRMWNLSRLKKIGVNLLPVVHDPYAGEIDNLYDMGYHYMLLGSSWGNDRKQLDFLFNRYYYSGRYPGIRFHKLGTATYGGLCVYPYYSCDSANFIKMGAWGEVFFWNEDREPDKNGDQTDIIYFGGYNRPRSSKSPAYYDYPFRQQLEDFLWKTFEYRPTDITGSGKAAQRWQVNGKYLLDLQERITRMFEQAG